MMIIYSSEYYSQLLCVSMMHVASFSLVLGVIYQSIEFKMCQPEIKLKILVKLPCYFR